MCDNRINLDFKQIKDIDTTHQFIACVVKKAKGMHWRSEAIIPH